MLPNASTMKVDLADFDLIPEAQRPVSCCAVNVSPSGQVSLNKRMLEELRRQSVSLKLGFACHKQDKRILLLFPTNTPNYTFPASGSRKDTNFAQALVEDGIALPARYTMTWNEGAGAWVGILNAERVPDALSVSLKAGQSVKRSKK